jgi:hypothetical protein
MSRKPGVIQKELTLYDTIFLEKLVTYLVIQKFLRGSRKEIRLVKENFYSSLIVSIYYQGENNEF